MKNQKTILVGIAVLIAVAALVYYFNTETVATTDYGITKANIECSGNDYVFTGSFYTWRIGTHQVQVFCDDNPSNNILNFYETEITSSGTYEWSVTRNINDFNNIMPCDKVCFQLYDADASTTFFRTEDESMPECGITPTPTATPAPTPNGDTTNDNIWLIGGVAALVLLIYFAFIKKQRM
jgi:uncharacterized protein (UPF0333 family)